MPGWDFSDTDGDSADWWMRTMIIPVWHGRSYGGGNGTAEDPYQIWTPEQMNAIGANPEDWASHFKLMADIDMSAYIGTQYNIIGNVTTYFTGTLRQRSCHTNLTITASSQDYVGLFGHVVRSGGQIRNLGIENVNISGHDYVGGLAGVNNGIITSCYVTGSVSGWVIMSAVWWGLISFGTITSCYATGSVSGTGDMSAVWWGIILLAAPSRPVMPPALSAVMVCRRSGGK